MQPWPIDQHVLFFPWDLYKFYFKILIYSSLDNAKVLHLLSFGFVVFVDNPVSIASYLASLLAVGNRSWILHSMMSSSKDCRTIPIPPTCLLDDSSVQTFHGAAAPLPSTLFVINFVMKSTSAWAETNFSIRGYLSSTPLSTQLV